MSVVAFPYFAFPLSVQLRSNFLQDTNIQLKRTYGYKMYVGQRTGRSVNKQLSIENEQSIVWSMKNINSMLPQCDHQLLTVAVVSRSSFCFCDFFLQNWNTQWQYASAQKFLIHGNGYGGAVVMGYALATLVPYTMATKVPWRCCGIIA